MNIGRRFFLVLTALVVGLGASFALHEEGEAITASETVSIRYGSTVTGSDGGSYNVKFKGNILFYNENGSTYTRNETELSDAMRKYLVLTSASTGETDIGYCIEFCARLFQGDYHTGKGYMEDAKFFKNLPSDVKKLILTSVYYGRNGINKVPVEGANDGDFYFATQTIIWEVQQQLRVFVRDSNGRVTGTKRVDAHSMSKDYFYSNLAGRPAEKCYNYILEQVSGHYILPSFVAESVEKATAVELKYDMKQRLWTAAADKESTGIDFYWNDSDIKFDNTKTQCCFTTETPIQGEKPVEVRRKTGNGSASENLLIWHNNVDSDRQVIATGSASPPTLFMKLSTDIPAELTVKKVDSETGKAIPVKGVSYKMKSLKRDEYVSEGMSKKDGDMYYTDETGQVTLGEKLEAGDYALQEIRAPKGYVVAKNSISFSVSGEDEAIEIEQGNVPQKGIIIIKKTGEYKHLENWADIREKVIGGIDFDIIALDDIVTADGTVRVKKGEVVDTVRTDVEGNVSSVPLYLGPYNVVEKNTPVEYRINEPINIFLEYTNQDTEVMEKKINILNRLKARGDSLGNTPRTGDESGINTALLTVMGAGTLILIMSLLFALRREK
ncbi:MAG: Cys-Gln thioester bond-forming surface protein [Clostridiales bacterium]|nr:Cys-Gln thioester bond-forming surface protein [Clostridiales bacterium]